MMIRDSLVRKAMLVAVALVAGHACADPAPLPGTTAAADAAHVRVIDYAPDMIVPLETTPGFAVTIDFGDGEKIETVSIGDSNAWQISPNHRGDLLFVKPMAAPAATNMTVATGLRVYYFTLRAVAGKRGAIPPHQIFALHFAHPAPATVAVPASPPPAAETSPPPPRVANAAYSFEGARDALPLRVFDDGVATWFRFAPAMDLPAIFVREADGSLGIANVANRDGYVVIDRIAPSFELRRGKTVTRVFNDAFHPEAGAASELPAHDQRHRKPRRPSEQAHP